MSGAPPDPRDARIAALEAALAAIRAEAQAARFALCAHELTMRLENIDRLAAAIARPEPEANDAG